MNWDMLNPLAWNAVQWLIAGGATAALGYVNRTPLLSLVSKVTKAKPPAGLSAIEGPIAAIVNWGDAHNIDLRSECQEILDKSADVAIPPKVKA